MCSCLEDQLSTRQTSTYVLLVVLHGVVDFAVWHRESLQSHSSSPISVSAGGVGMEPGTHDEKHQLLLWDFGQKTLIPLG